MITTPDTEQWRAVYDFWFPPNLDSADFEQNRRVIEWWFRGGINAELAPFVGVVTKAKSGHLDGWRNQAQGRMSLILVLDQFARGLFAGTPEAYASDLMALQIAEEGLENGDFDALTGLWEKLIFILPLIHAEGPKHIERIERNLAITEKMADRVPPQLFPLYQFSISQARGQLEVISRFGRFPHRNAVLGRASTPEEEAYMEANKPVHTRQSPTERNDTN
jgi:uncharacterized protein (DUF924 family)